MSITKPRGTQDLFGPELLAFKHVMNQCVKLADIFGFEHVITPLFENAELFHRNNENSDIVKKELYEFKDRGDRLLALRPEATASIIRFLGENKLLKKQPLPMKVYTYGSMFRYERPQSGRQREFQQFDVEIVGADSEYEVANVINFGNELLKQLGLLSKIELRINFIGSFASRTKWIKALQKYFEKYKDKLSALSQERLSKNPLRILDDKVDGKLDFVKKAPQINEFLTKEENDEFTKVLKLLDTLKIKHKITPNLVRGLDYYTNVVFEFVDQDSDITVIGGGQYDNLVAELTGEDLRSIGLAVGVNRCANLLDAQVLQKIQKQNQKRILLIGTKDIDSNLLLTLCQKLINQDIKIVYDPRFKDISKAIKFCERANYRYLAIVGKNEVQNNQLTLKDLDTKEQLMLEQNKLIKWWTEIKE